MNQRRKLQELVRKFLIFAYFPFQIPYATDTFNDAVKTLIQMLGRYREHIWLGVYFVYVKRTSDILVTVMTEKYRKAKESADS